MRNAPTFTHGLRLGTSAIAGVALCLQAPLAKAESQNDLRTTEVRAEHVRVQNPRLQYRGRTTTNDYLLGPGDGLKVEVLDLPQLSGVFSIGPDGNIHLPRLRTLYAEGLTVEEFRILLTERFRIYVRNPQVYVHPVIYRAIRVYVGGEVKRPGYYKLTGIQSNEAELKSMRQTQSWLDSGDPEDVLQLNLETENRPFIANNVSESSPTLFPTVFDAIRSAQGITPYSDLAQVKLTRRRAEGLGGGRVQTKLNFLSLITDGDHSQNIRLVDGDVINVRRSPVVLRDQLLKAGQSNLSPQFIQVFVTGRVKEPGAIKIPQGASLNQAISMAGGTKFLKGRVEFFRFASNGTINRKVFAYKPSAAVDSPTNPILASGDTIRIRDSLVSGTAAVFNELTEPIIGFYSLYNLLNVFQ